MADVLALIEKPLVEAQGAVPGLGWVSTVLAVKVRVEPGVWVVLLQA